MVTEPTHSLAGCLWKKISHEVAVKLLANVAVSFEGLMCRAKRLLPNSFMWCFEYHVVPCHMGLYTEVSNNMSATFYQ